MPRFERNGSIEGPVIERLGERGFTVDGGVYEALLLTPRLAQAWAPSALADLTIAALEPALAIEPAPEFLILGTGRTYRPPPRALVEALEVRGIGIEVMDSRAAARTWGLLRGEHRWIAAAIMPQA
jgi:uncharacterized protein